MLSQISMIYPVAYVHTRNDVEVMSLATVEATRDNMKKLAERTSEETIVINGLSGPLKGGKPVDFPVPVANVWRVESGGVDLLKCMMPRVPEIALDSGMKEADVVSHLTKICSAATFSRRDRALLHNIEITTAAKYHGRKRAREMPAHIGCPVRRCFKMKYPENGRPFKMTIDGTVIKKWESSETTHRKPLWSVQYASDEVKFRKYIFDFDDDVEDLEEEELLEAMKAYVQDKKAKSMEAVQCPPVGTVGNPIGVE